MKPTFENEAIAAAAFAAVLFLIASAVVGALACKLFSLFDEEISTEFETLKERNQK